MEQKFDNKCHFFAIVSSKFVVTSKSMEQSVSSESSSMKPGGSLPYLQEPATGDSHEKDESSHVHTATSYFLKTDLNINLISIPSGGGGTR